LGDSVGQERTNIINTVIRQVMCNGREDIIQPNPYDLPRRSLVLFGNHGLRVCRIRYAEHTFSQLYTGSHSYYMDENGSKWRGIPMHMD